MNLSSASSASVLSALRARLGDRVVAPDHPDYDRSRCVFYGSVDCRPAAIVRAAGADDVSEAIAIARDSGAELAVKGGGHSMAGHGVCDEGVVLDLSGMRDLAIDVEGRTAWAGAGLTTGAYTAAAARHGLATGFGDTGSVGIGGITLGGGVGFLARKHGLTIDHLLAADVVTADGAQLRVSEDSHPDLFWAIRGGGGNFGVVTRFQFRLHELPSIVGGMLLLPATPDLVEQFIAEAEQAPEELSIIANVMPAPRMPFILQEHRGRLVVLALMVYAGETEAGERAVAPFRALATPLVDMVRPTTYAEMFPPEPEGYRPIATGRNLFVDAVDRAMAEGVLDGLRASTAQMAAVQFRVLGGAVSRVPAEATAYAHRARRIMVNVGAMFGSVDEMPVHDRWAAQLASALNGGDTSAYVNFIGAEGEARVRDAYPAATWQRLRAIKRQYDPSNLFRRNQNIPPLA